MAYRRWGRYSTKVTALGGTWQIAICLAAVGACKPSGPPPPIPLAAEGDPLWHGHTRPHLPQVRDADPLFDSLQPQAPIVLRAGLLVCRIDAVENPDTRDPASGPDLTMSIAIGGSQRIVRGRSDSWQSTVSVASIDITRGDDIRVEVWDNDDFSGDERIGELDGRFDGSFPIIMRDAALAVECRALPQHELATRLATSLREADSALDDLEAALVPNLLASSLDFPKQQVAAARHAITTAAGYAGWNPPDIRLRVARATALGREWIRRVYARVDALVAELPAPGEHVPIANARVSAQLDCDPNRVAAVAPPDGVHITECLLDVTLAPDSSRDFWYSSGISARLIARDGTSFSTREVRAESNGRALDHERTTVVPGQELRVTLAVRDLRGARPQLAAVGMRKVAPVLIRVR